MQTITVTESDLFLIITILAQQQGLPLSGDTQVTIDNGTIVVVDELVLFGQVIRTEISARPSVSQGNVIVDIDTAVSANQPLPPEVVGELKQVIEQGIMDELRNTYGCEEILTLVAESGQLVATCR